MVRVKICGITRAEDAVAAAEAGADALGFIFVEESPRFIHPERVREIVRGLPTYVKTVGVFVNAPWERIRRTVDISGVHCAQLHGDESPEDVAAIHVPVVKAFRVRPGFDVTVLSRYRCAACLLDTYVEGVLGGSGRTFDWQVAVKAKEHGRIIVSGGLTPENVLQAVQKTRPYAVDVSSGVEVQAGAKDMQRIAAFIGQVRLAEQEITMEDIRTVERG